MKGKELSIQINSEVYFRDEIKIKTLSDKGKYHQQNINKRNP